MKRLVLPSMLAAIALAACGDPAPIDAGGIGGSSAGGNGGSVAPGGAGGTSSGGAGGSAVGGSGGGAAGGAGGSATGGAGGGATGGAGGTAGGGPACDRDGDRFDSVACGGLDCDDTNPDVNPRASEVCDPDDVDEDCDPTTFGRRDGDNDGSVDAACCNVAADGTRTCGADCDDAQPLVNEGVAESRCDGADDDCDGEIDEGLLRTFYRDDDLDGFGIDADSVQACNAAGVYQATIAGDTGCDADPSRHPNLPDGCDRIDNDCDGTTDEDPTLMTYYRDDDQDGFGVDADFIQSCGPQGVYSAVQPGDSACDNDPARHPNLADGCDDRDDDCDGQMDEDAAFSTLFYDADSDGYGTLSRSVCRPKDGYTAVQGGDCDDANGSTHPNAAEVCNHVDDNCVAGADEGLNYEWCNDADGDTWCDLRFQCNNWDCMAPGPTWRPRNSAIGGCQAQTDCDDSVGYVYPSQTEDCGGGDLDCDGNASNGYNLGAGCSAGVGACQQNGALFCSSQYGSGCSVSGGAPDTSFHTSPAPNGSWDWDCANDGGQWQHHLEGWLSNAPNFCAGRTHDACVPGWGAGESVGEFWFADNVTDPNLVNLPNLCGQPMYIYYCYWYSDFWGASCQTQSTASISMPCR